MKKILIIEDEDLIAFDLENRMKKQGYNVFLVKEEKDAINVVANNKIDLALVDISLGTDKTGIEIVKELYKVADVPVIYITAYDDEYILEKINKTTPYGYILKPFDEKELFFTINIAIEKAVRDRLLKQQHKWVVSILDSITDLIIVTDKKKTISFANLVAKETFNIEPKSQTLEDELIFYDSENHEFDNKFIQQVTHAKTPHIFSKMTIKSSKTGKKIKATCSFVPIHKVKGNMAGVVITIKKET